MANYDISKMEDLTVTLTLDDDTELECAVITIFEADGHDYIALLPLEGEDFEDGSVYLYRYAEVDGEPELQNIKTDEEYDIVSDAFDEWLDLDSQLIMKKVIITRSEINGKSLSDLKVRSLFGVNITRVTRAGVDLVADGDLELQIGDRVLVVGDESSVEGLARYFGNSLKRLREPHLISIFIGIAVGVLFGSIPFMLPGIPQPVKLGLAGGPLVVAILISRFGCKLGFITYTTQSANIMLREIGISLFLAAVGLGAGENFVETLVGGGYRWVGYGFIITVLPLLIVSVLARFLYKQNYFTIIGLIAGSTTDPPALAYSNSISSSNYPAVAYATVYPLVMFLRVLTAQLIVLYAL